MRTHIFDLDGTLADTVGIHYKVEHALLKSKLEKEHISGSKKTIDKLLVVLTKLNKNAKMFQTAFHDPFYDASYWTDIKNILVFNEIKRVKLQVFPSILKTIKRLSRNKNNKLYLFSSSEIPLVWNLIKYWKLDKCFLKRNIISTYDKINVYKILKVTYRSNVIVYEDDLKYLNLCKKMGVTCYRCNKGKIKLYYK